jgi:hypothetical protein
VLSDWASINEIRELWGVICPMTILTILGMLTLSAYSALRNGIEQIRTLHQILYMNYAFFTRNYRLKFTIHPVKALLKEAIDCLDYEPLIFPVASDFPSFYKTEDRPKTRETDPKKSKCQNCENCQSRGCPLKFE